MSEHAVDPARVYVAGLSAGGAAAAIMGAAYPDLYAAVGVHSGLACGAAQRHALGLRRDAAGRARRRRIARPAAAAVPTIVFHGDSDTTVSPRNGEQVVAQAGRSGHLAHPVDPGPVPRRARLHPLASMATRTARPVLEHWLLHGAGHAWSGGSPAGSYTDPRGPDASREMLRFFLGQQKPAAASPH